MNSQTILLIDDDQTLLELLSGHLQTAGYQPLTASDGPNGLHLAVEASHLIEEDHGIGHGWRVQRNSHATTYTSWKQRPSCKKPLLCNDLHSTLAGER